MSPVELTTEHILARGRARASRTDAAADADEDEDAGAICEDESEGCVVQVVDAEQAAAAREKDMRERALLRIESF